MGNCQFSSDMLGDNFLNKAEESALLILVEDKHILLIIEHHIIPAVLKVGDVHPLGEVLIRLVLGGYVPQELVHCCLG